MNSKSLKKLSETQLQKLAQSKRIETKTLTKIEIIDLILAELEQVEVEIIPANVSFTLTFEEFRNGKYEILSKIAHTEHTVERFAKSFKRAITNTAKHTAMAHFYGQHFRLSIDDNSVEFIGGEFSKGKPQLVKEINSEVKKNQELSTILEELENGAFKRDIINLLDIKKDLIVFVKYYTEFSNKETSLERKEAILTDLAKRFEERLKERFSIDVNFEINKKSKKETKSRIIESSEIDVSFDEKNHFEEEILKVISGDFAQDIVDIIEYDEKTIQSKFNDFQAFHICKGIKNKHVLYNKYIKDNYSEEDVYEAHKTANEALDKYGMAMINFLLSLPELPFRSDNFKNLFSILDKRRRHNKNPIIRLRVKNPNSNNPDEYDEIEFSFVIANSQTRVNQIRIRNKTKNTEIANVSRNGKIIPSENTTASGKSKSVTPVLQFFYQLTQNEENIKEAIISFGIESGKCSICGKELSNLISKQRGIGRTCEKNMFG